MSRVYVCCYSAVCCCRSLRCAKRPLFAFVAPEILARPTFLTLVRIFDVSRCGFQQRGGWKTMLLWNKKDAGFIVLAGLTNFHFTFALVSCDGLRHFPITRSSLLFHVPWPWIDQHPWCSIRAPLCLGSYETFASLLVFSGVFHFQNRNWMMICNDFPIFQGGGSITNHAYKCSHVQAIVTDFAGFSACRSQSSKW